MVFRVELTSLAHCDLIALDRAVAKRILTKLQWFSVQDEPLRFSTPLAGQEGLVRFRVGDYRVIVFPDVKKRLLRVVALGHRRDVYKSK